MRKIKFRAWITYGYTEEDLKNPDMVDEIKETGLGFMGTPDLIDSRNDEIRVKYGGDWYDSDRFSLMQSTGLKDKNGKEIYEGDIVAIGKYKYEVVWNERKGWYGIDDGDNGLTVLAQHLDYIEVAGNIYETPELLGGQNEGYTI